MGTVWGYVYLLASHCLVWTVRKVPSEVTKDLAALPQKLLSDAFPRLPAEL